MIDVINSATTVKKGFDFDYILGYCIKKEVNHLIFFLTCKVKA